jgi:uncharacterized Ntn-hydrolase superfamily protein/tetratricopeptide (TPR) repeat protein
MRSCAALSVGCLLTLLTPARGAELPGAAREALSRAAAHDAKRQFEQAIAEYTKVIEAAPDAMIAYQRRGEDHFRLAHFKESVADFDKVIALDPAREPYHWQRGISLYYAGEFKRGAEQFDKHRAVNPDDVENAAWHYLCVARASGVEKAKASLIPIRGDTRVPMMKVHALYAGTATPRDVMEAASVGDADEARLRLFYAHLYVGLFHEAAGRAAEAREHILLAAEKYAGEDYMGDVAQAHAIVLKKHDAKAAAQKGAAPEVNTFSIVAYDPEAKEWAVGVASRVLGVGTIVPWARAGVGAIATQSYANITYGPRGLDLLAQGKSAQEVLDLLVKSDDGRAKRQVGVVDAQGNVANFTGKECNPWAGDKAGKHYTCQGNLLAGEAVIADMSAAFEDAKGPLTWRVMAALEAAEKAGGDKRGKQSAAILVVKEKAGYNGDNDRMVDLRVDDNAEPVKELGRIVALRVKRPE